MQAQEGLSNRMNRLEMVVGCTNWSSSVDLKNANEIPANETKDSNVESVGNLSQTVEALQRSTTFSPSTTLHFLENPQLQRR